MSDKLKIAIEKVYNELLALNSDEFGEILDRHAGGDIAKIILETGALDVGKIESDGFASQEEGTYYTFPTFNVPTMGDYLRVQKPLHNLWHDKISLNKGAFASNLYELNNDIGVISWVDNLGFLTSDVKSSILCTAGGIDYKFIDVRQPDEFKITSGSEELSDVGSIYIGYGSTTVMVNFEEAYSVADNYDWAEAA